MELNTGIYGAKRQSFHKDSPRAILLGILERYKSETDEKLFEIVFEELSERPACLKAVAEYWFANELRNVSRSKTLRSRLADPATEQKRGELARNLQAHIDRRVQIQLLEMLMPSGIQLRDSEKEECARAGGWFLKVAERLRDGQRVGDVFNEDALRQLYLGAA